MPDLSRLDGGPASPQEILLQASGAQFYSFALSEGHALEWSAAPDTEQQDWQAVVRLAREQLRLIDANDAFARQHGFDGRAAILESGFTFAQMFRDEALFERTLKAIFSIGDQPDDQVTQQLDRAGRTRFIRSITAVQRSGGGIGGLYGAQWDVTESYATRAILEAQNKQTSTIQSISHLIESRLPVSEFLTRVAEYIPAAMQYPELAIAAIEFDDKVYGAEEVLTNPSRIAYGIVVDRQEVGRVHIAYLEQRLFAASESAYIRSVAELIGGYVNRIRGESQIAQLGAAVEHAVDGIALANMEGYIQFVNPAWARMHGYEPEELIGKHLSVFYTLEQLREEVEQFNQKVLREGSGASEIEHVRRDGSIFPTWMTSALVRDAEGQTIGLVATARDITEQKKLLVDLNNRTERLQTASEVSRAASSILNSEELIRRSVDLIRERFGYYYVGLFLVDETGEWSGEPQKWAVLRAGTGEAGREMMACQHKLEVGGNSMVGQSIALGQARIAVDVGAEARRFDNLLLPDTRSEVALPLISRGQAIGALTIQSAQEAAFSEADVTVLQIMADQLAIAIQTALLFEQAQLRAERERLVRTIADRIYRATDRESIMRITLQELGQLLGASRSIVRLGTREQLLADRAD